MKNIAEYVNYLIVSPVKYNQEYFGTYHEQISHDQLNRQMRFESVRPRAIWESVKGDIISSKQGYIVFDDTTLDKSHSSRIELSGLHWSGNKKKVVTGISVVTCVYVNPEIDRWWVIDYRIFHKLSDGKSKLDHMEEMLRHTKDTKQLSFRGVLMDTWYATTEMMTIIANLKKYFYCPIQSNRLVSRGTHWTYPAKLDWDEETLQMGQTILLKDLSKSVPIRLHRRTLLTKTGGASHDFIITNDVTLMDSEAVGTINGYRWKVEELHRELKQLTGIEKCQCRKARAQRNHIACAMLAWITLKRAAYQLKATVYNLKTRLLDDYMILRLNHLPSFVI